jgi:hypothetical protein
MGETLRGGRAKAYHNPPGLCSWVGNSVFRLVVASR